MHLPSLARSSLCSTGGAGSGEFVAKELAGGWCRHAAALEFDSTNFSLLKSRLGGRADAKVMQGSLLEVPCADASFDLVQSTQVLEHIEDHGRAAAELVRILKPGGHALITVPHPPEPFPNEGHVREGYTQEDMINLFGPLGLDVIHWDWFLIDETVRRMMKADHSPLSGLWVPLAWVDAEVGLDREKRRTAHPFGILALLRNRP